MCSTPNSWNNWVLSHFDGLATQNKASVVSASSTAAWWRRTQLKPKPVAALLRYTIGRPFPLQMASRLSFCVFSDKRARIASRHNAANLEAPNSHKQIKSGLFQFNAREKCIWLTLLSSSRVMWTYRDSVPESRIVEERRSATARTFHWKLVYTEEKSRDEQHYTQILKYVRSIWNAYFVSF